MTEPIIIDPSAVLAILFADEDDTYARETLEYAARHGSFVPRLFWYELRHVIIKGVRHGRTSLLRGQDQIDLLRGLIIKTIVDPSDRTVLDVAERGQLTGYDAVYAALALREQTSLATMDKGLKSAAKILGYDVWQAS